MKLTKITTAAATLAFAALLGTSARAVSVGSSGDLIIGFDQSGATENYEVDLGSASQFLNPLAATQTFDLSDADLDAYFGDNWATVTTNAGPPATNAVQWGLIGANTTGGNQTLGLSTVPKNTLFISQNTWATVPIEKSTSLQGTPEGDVNHLYNGNANVSSSAGSTVALPAHIVAAGNANGFDVYAATGTNFGGTSGYTKSELDFNSNDTLAAADALTLDLYELVPTDAASPQGTQLLGTFSLVDSGTAGVLTFTAAPEPSTYLLMAIGGLVVVWRLRRNASAA
jgi:hypothetical protein